MPEKGYLERDIHETKNAKARQEQEGEEKITFIRIHR